MNATPMHVRTPLIRSSALSRRSGRDVWLKMETAQPTGSFKIRGIGHACERYAARGARGFVSSSGGNAGLAVAYAGRLLGLPVTVITPTTTSARAIELIGQEGAEVRVHGKNWDEANALALQLASDERPLIHAFDDPLSWEGHASLVDEISAAWKDEPPDAVVGGGGLLCGTLLGLGRAGWTTTRVMAMETEGAASFHAAQKAGKPIAIDAITSVATSLGARQVADQAFLHGRRPNVSSHVVTDQEAVGACASFLDDHRVLVEPACGASLAPIYARHPFVADAQRIVVIVCGGVGVSRAQLRTWEERLGL